MVHSSWSALSPPDSRLRSPQSTMQRARAIADDEAKGRPLWPPCRSLVYVWAGLRRRNSAQVGDGALLRRLGVVGGWLALVFVLIAGGRRHGRIDRRQHVAGHGAELALDHAHGVLQHDLHAALVLGPPA